MKSLTRSLERVIFSFSALGVLSSIEFLNLPPALASTTYYGGDADVTVRCFTKDRQSSGSFSIDGRRSGTKFIQVLGLVYFDKARSQPVAVTSLPQSIISSVYDNGRPANDFSAAVGALGFSGVLNGVISLPDLSENPDKALGYDTNCPLIPTNADGGDGSGGGSGGGGCVGYCGATNYIEPKLIAGQGMLNFDSVQVPQTPATEVIPASPKIASWQGKPWQGESVN
jgi:hypothetical protein